MNHNPKAKGLPDSFYADLSMAMPIGQKEPLVEDIGAIDGDDCLRLLSLCRIKNYRWLQHTIDMFRTRNSAKARSFVPLRSANQNRITEVWQRAMMDKKVLRPVLLEQNKEMDIEDAGVCSGQEVKAEVEVRAQVRADVLLVANVVSLEILQKSRQNRNQGMHRI